MSRVRQGCLGAWELGRIVEEPKGVREPGGLLGRSGRSVENRRIDGGWEKEGDSSYQDL